MRSVAESKKLLLFEQAVMSHFDAAYSLARWLTQSSDDNIHSLSREAASPERLYVQRWSPKSSSSASTDYRWNSERYWFCARLKTSPTAKSPTSLECRWEP